MGLKRKKYLIFSILFIFSFLLTGCFTRLNNESEGNNKKGSKVYNEFLTTILRSELNKAKTSYDRGSYKEAIDIASELILKYPGGGIELRNAQWLLARSYDAEGDIGSAKIQYKLYLNNYPNDESAGEAKKRYDLLKDFTGFKTSGEVILDIRRADILSKKLPANLFDVAYNPEKGKFITTDKIDLFNPWIRQTMPKHLAEKYKGVNHIGMKAVYSEFDGFSPSALSEFNKVFGLSLTKEELLIEISINENEGGKGRPALFWKWSGWKMRRTLSLLEEIAGMRKESKGFQKISLILEPAVVYNPEEGLKNYSQDLLESYSRNFDYIFIAQNTESEGLEVSRFKLLEKINWMLGENNKIVIDIGI